MSLEQDRQSRDRSDESLREILEAAEHRREAEWKAKGRNTTLVVGIPLAALVLWAVVFLIQYRVANPPVVETKPVVVAKPAIAEDRKDMQQFDAFRPNSERVIKHPEPAPGSGKIVDKGDIDFAMRLLNFGQAADKPAAKTPPEPKRP